MHLRRNLGYCTRLSNTPIVHTSLQHTSIHRCRLDIGVHVDVFIDHDVLDNKFTFLNSTFFLQSPSGFTFRSGLLWRFSASKQNFATNSATMFQSSRRIIFGLVTLLAAASTITQVVAVPVASPGGGSGTQSIVIPPDATTSFQKYLHPEDKTSQHVIYGDAKEVEQKLPFLSEKEQSRCTGFIISAKNSSMRNVLKG
ncbi:hypothetical protein FB446DRAFT_747578 [Lentinula raphanica]|nr:hypothetical protein FB446DRAFT_747578 [Lentinula raphanica]